MANPGLTDEQCRQAMRLYAEHGGNMSAAARAAGMPEPTFRVRVARGRQRGLSLEAPAEPAPATDAGEQRSELDALKNELLEARAQLRAVRENTLTDEYVKRKIIGLVSEIETVREPGWALRAVRGESLPGVPIAFWSDWHWGEVVDVGELGGVNEFNLEIAHSRARTLVEKTIHLLTKHVVNPKYPGIVVALGGDMLSGDIHDELTATNDQPMMPCLLDLYGAMRWALTAMADRFGNVFVPCVAGNHGRTTRKPRMKQRAFTNFDWLLYQFLARSFEGDDRIRFYVPDGPDALFSVFGHRYLLTHGDQFRGGDGIIGAIGPITRGNSRKQARNSAINMAYDTMLLGHWHQYMPLHRTIVNGSLKGYDEYANQNNFGYEPPTQALWITHPEHGITQHWPVYLDSRVGAERSGGWVSWKDAA